MGLLDDLTGAIEDYPHDYLEIEIVDVDWPGNVIDAHEAVAFRVRVTNSGPLHVDSLRLLVEGLNGTEIKPSGAAATYSPAYTTTAGFFPRVPAHSPNSPVELPGGDFYFKPNRGFTNITDLLQVSVADFTTNFDHLWAHTDADPAAKDVYASTVSAA